MIHQLQRMGCLASFLLKGNAPTELHAFFHMTLKKKRETSSTHPPPPPLFQIREISRPTSALLSKKKAHANLVMSAGSITQKMGMQIALRKAQAQARVLEKLFPMIQKLKSAMTSETLASADLAIAANFDMSRKLDLYSQHLFRSYNSSHKW